MYEAACHRTDSRVRLRVRTTAMADRNQMYTRGPLFSSKYAPVKKS